jgi:protein-tyrosine phosphatase
MEILFVCTGNTCRSVLAEYLLRKKLADKGLGAITVRSAGVAAFSGMLSSEGAVEVLKARGVDGSGHRSHPVTEEWVTSADLILTMEARHRTWILEHFPRANRSRVKEKVHEFKSFVGSSGDVADPVGQSLSTYECCAQEIEAILEKIIPILKRGESHECIKKE